MGKQEKNDQMAKLYRQFSKQRYNKYKHQFPRMRESEIVQKIIKQWQELNARKKQQLLEQFLQNGVITKTALDESLPIKSPMKGKIRIVKKQLKKSFIPVKIIQEEVQHKIISQQSDFHRSASQPKSIGDSQSDKGSLTKRKIIRKLNSSANREYLTFFRHYFQKFTRQHRKWNSAQKSTIIKLLWRKKKQQKKMENRMYQRLSGKQTKSMKVLTGRMAFKKAKLKCNYSRQEITRLWKQLPNEGKKLWARIGLGQREKTPKGKTIIKYKSELKSQKEIKRAENYPNTFNFMNKSIR